MVFLIRHDHDGVTMATSLDTLVTARLGIDEDPDVVSDSPSVMVWSAPSTPYSVKCNFPEITGRWPNINPTLLGGYVADTTHRVQCNL